MSNNLTWTIVSILTGVKYPIIIINIVPPLVSLLCFCLCYITKSCFGTKSFRKHLLSLTFLVEQMFEAAPAVMELLPDVKQTLCFCRRYRETRSSMEWRWAALVGLIMAACFCSSGAQTTGGCDYAAYGSTSCVLVKVWHQWKLFIPSIHWHTHTHTQVSFEVHTRSPNPAQECVCSWARAHAQLTSSQTHKHKASTGVWLHKTFSFLGLRLQIKTSSTDPVVPASLPHRNI